MDSPSDSSAPEAIPRSTSAGVDDASPPVDAAKDAFARVAELKEYVSYFIAAKIDGLKLTARKIVLYAVLGIVGAIAGIGLLVTAAVFLISGLAGAIGELFPEPYEWWAGRLIVSVVVLAGAFAGVFLLMRSLTGSARKRTIEKYEARKRDERQLYGHDVQERAREQVQRQNGR